MKPMNEQLAHLVAMNQALSNQRNEAFNRLADAQAALAVTQQRLALAHDKLAQMTAEQSAAVVDLERVRPAADAA